MRNQQNNPRHLDRGNGGLTWDELLRQSITGEGNLCIYTQSSLGKIFLSYSSLSMLVGFW